jgi:hypothetical protein
MTERTWPEDIEPRSKEDWLAAAESGDPQEVQLIGKVLKLLKYSARDYVAWSKEDRVETLYKHQCEAHGENGASTKVTTGKKAGKAGKLGKKRKGAAAPVAAPAASAAPAAASTGTGGISAEQFKAITKALQAQASATEALAEKVQEYGAQLESIEAYVQETHFGFSCIALGDETIRSNFEDPSIQEEMLGELSILGEEEETEGEE